MRLIGLFLITMLAVSSLKAQTHRVRLSTTEGDMVIELFDDTPRHRDNFLQLAQRHFYDSLLFHRVIKGFMIQAGDPQSRYAEPGATVGEGDVGYTLEPEFRTPQHYHRRGAVAMAREDDRHNPERRSSGCQFYIVWGKTFSSKQMEDMQVRLDSMTHHQVTLTPEMIYTYRHVGGAPHLDGQYTVFGQVVEGWDVLYRIQRSYTDDYDRPVDDVRIVGITELPQ